MNCNRDLVPATGNSSFALLWRLAIRVTATGSFLFCVYSPENLAHASADVPTIHHASLILAPEAKRIQGLEWQKKDADVLVEQHGDSVQTLTSVSGSFDRPGWTLLYEEESVAIGPSGEFQLNRIFLTEPTTELDFVAVSPKGDLEEERLLIQVPNWDLIYRPQDTASIKGLGVTAGLGLSLINFSDERISPITETAITAKASYRYQISSSAWDLRVNSYVTVLPLTMSLAGYTARFFGANATGGYSIMPKDTWRLSLLAGVYYTTMFVSPETFGFRNMIGPELFLTVRKELPRGHSSTAYFKFALVQGGSFFRNLENREIAFGGMYSHKLRNGRSISISGDFSLLSLVITTISISASSLTVGASYSF